MKKIAFFAAALLAFAGCQKNEIQDNASQQKLITRTFTVDSEDARAKSFFDPTDQCVKLKNDESIAVAYSNATYGGDLPVVGDIVEATKSGDKYSFSHSAITDATGYNYYFVMPYRGKTNINTNAAKTSVYVKVDGVQHPTATSFDPLQDYVIGQPVYGATEQMTALSAADLKLKRICAIVRVTLRDGGNVFNGAALKSASIGFPLTENSDKKNNLATLAYLKFSEDFNNTAMSGYADVTTTHVSPTVTAEYDEGLPAVATENGNTYTVWYVTLPVEKAAGTTLTVTAQSATKKITREIAIPKKMTLTAGIINDISINITGDGYVTEDLVDENDYWSIYNAGQDIVAGGITINKRTHSATLLEGENATRANLQKGGVIFLNGNIEINDGNLKPIKGSIIIGRYKNSQPKITTNLYQGTKSSAIYLDNGNIIFKNINVVAGTSTANRLFVISAPVASNYAVIEDCSITANKTVLGYSAAEPANVIKAIRIENCVIKMAGTDGNYSVMNIAASTLTDFSVYKNIEEFSIRKCIIYADAAAPLSGEFTRRPLMDLGNAGTSSNGKSYYYIPLPNAQIIVTNNTLYNINANSNCLVRAYYAKSAEISNNVIYNDYSTLGTAFTYTYMFGLYNNNDGNPGTYNIKNNYSYGYYIDSQAAYVTGTVKYTMKWPYTATQTVDGVKVPVSPTYTTSSNSNPDGTMKNQPFSSVNLTNGYFPVNTANTNGVTGASYESKPWVK